MRRQSSRPAGRATDREVGVVAAVLEAGSTTTAQLVWILAPRLPEPDGSAPDD
jgi:hypothetical protein